MPRLLPSRDTAAGECVAADRYPLFLHPATVARQQGVPGWQRQVLVEAPVGAGLRQPTVVLGQGSRLQLVAMGDLLQPIGIVAAAGRIDVQQLAGDGVDRYVVALDAALEAALPAAIAQGFPFLAVQFT